jgi:HK97 family phage major capsid protein
MVARLRATNAPFARPGWVFNGRLLNTLEKLKDSTGRYLQDAGLLTFDRAGGGGTLLGFPFVTTSQIGTNLTRGTSTDTTYVVFGSDWDEGWAGEAQELQIALSTDAAYQDSGGVWHSSFTERQTLFRATTVHDFALRRPQLWVVMEGIRP